MKKILVPVDFSQNSLDALHIGAAIAQKTGAALEILHVNLLTVAAPLSEFGVATEYGVDDQQYKETAKTALQNLRNEVLGTKGQEKLKVSTRLEDGHLYACVRDVAKEDGADLVVIGTKGASGLTEFLIGSNTEKVIRTAPCPVLTVPSGVRSLDPKVVLMTSTLKGDQKRVFEYLAQWQKVFDFRVKVMYINNPANLPTDGSAEAEKNRLSEASGLKNTDVIVTEVTLSEEEAILYAADTYDADMIVMGTHQRRGISHFLFGSLTENTVNHSNTPVLAIPI
jgi:nucleotide-binding universal stress UspA family protein